VENKNTHVQSPEHALTEFCAQWCARDDVATSAPPSPLRLRLRTLSQNAIEFAFVFAMWAVMMVGMMAPSAAPMFLLYARVGRQGRIAGKPLAATGWFATGYFMAWIGFSLAATLIQWVLEREALLDPRMASASNTLGAVVLVAAGVYQWTPLKDVCLAQCQTPFGFLMRHGGFRHDVLGCLGLGLRHGAYCVGCCWVLMAFLFVVGVMNVLWIALLALLVLLEKLTPWGRWVARAAGVACVAAGVWMVSSVPAGKAGSLWDGPSLRQNICLSACWLRQIASEAASRR
jgi:predicted metal-binding membrane protein